MNEQKILEELESAIEAFEQSFAIITGLLAEQTDAKATFLHLVHAEAVASKEWGPNDWRDRLLRKAIAMSALKALPLAKGDPALQTLIAKVLTPRTGDEPSTH